MWPFKKREVKIGSVWILKQQRKDPFVEQTTKLQIIDVKDGWVKYSFLWNTGESLNVYHSKTISDLFDMYTLVE
jgi:hypothetical protein